MGSLQDLEFSAQLNRFVAKYIIVIWFDFNWTRFASILHKFEIRSKTEKFSGVYWRWSIWWRWSADNKWFTGRRYFGTISLRASVLSLNSWWTSCLVITTSDRSLSKRMKFMASFLICAPGQWLCITTSVINILFYESLPSLKYSVHYSHYDSYTEY